MQPTSAVLGTPHLPSETASADNSESDAAKGEVATKGEVKIKVKTSNKPALSLGSLLSKSSGTTASLHSPSLASSLGICVLLLNVTFKRLRCPLR